MTLHLAQHAKLMGTLTSTREKTVEVLYVLALMTGMRQGELLALQWSDVDLGSGKVQVRRSIRYVPKKGLSIADPKSTYSHRCIHLTPLAIDTLKRHAALQQQE